MNTNIIIPGKVSKAQPKPTKTQIAEALLKRAKIAHAKEGERVEKQSLEVQEQLRLEAIKLLKGIKPIDFEIDTSVRYFNEDQPLKCVIDLSTPLIMKLKKQISRLHPSRFDEEATKQKIKQGLAAPNPLLDNSEVAPALDQLLEKVMGYTPAIEA
jgi:hypothetical protein